MKINRLLVSSCAAAIAAGASAPAFAGDIAGHIYDSSETVALQAAQVRVVELDRVVATERDGSFVLAGLPAGTYTIEARYVGAETVTQSVDVAEIGTVTLDIAMGGGNQILVIGQAANQASALSRKREADGVSDVLTRDAVGQFPDQNVADSLRRLPGINVLNDMGEGRYVSVRGLDPELNAISMNGVRVPSPEDDLRSVQLDSVSSDIIESVEVKKSLTPDMDADTIGASIEIRTTSAFDRKKDLLTGKIEGSYNDYSGKLTPKGSVDFSTKLGDGFGIAGGLSYSRRKMESDTIEADGWDDDNGLIFAEEIQYRDYDVDRERISANLGFDFQPAEHTTLYLRGLYSQYDDQEFRRQTAFTFNEAPSAGAGTSVSFDDADGEIEVQRSIKDRFERQRIRSAVFGGETETDGWKASYSASWSKSTTSEPGGSVDSAKFEKGFEGDGLTVGIDYSDYRVPLFTVSGNTADFYDPAEYELDELEFVAVSNASDEEYAARFDLGREFYTDAGTFTVQSGVKGRWREKSFDTDIDFYENDDITVADVLGEQTYRLIDISPVTDYRSFRDFFAANPGDFEFIEADSIFNSAVEDYAVNEDIMSGYLLGRWDSGALRVIGGVRYEHTSNEIFGNNVLLVEEDGELPNGDIADEDTVLVSPVAYERKYDHWLPSLNIRWEAQNDLVVRLAGYRSLVRPKLSALAPRFVIEQNDDDEREGTFGNPFLKPNEAWNFDASLEYYLSGNGAVTAAVFYKDVKNFVAEIELDGPGTYQGIAFDEATTFINGQGGKIYGFEVGYSQAFTMLPSPFDGLLLQANYTYTNAKGDVPVDGDPTDLRKITLPTTSQNTFNLVLGYEKGPISFRLAGAYRDKYLDELGAEAEEDRYVQNHFQLDLTAKYRVSKNVQLFYEWVNINNAKLFAYNNYGNRQNLLEYAEYNWTMNFGAKVSF